MEISINASSYDSMAAGCMVPSSKFAELIKEKQNTNGNLARCHI